MMEGLGESGEIDLLDFFSELTLYTSSACLIGRQFREELSSEYYRVFYELEQGTDAIAYVNSNLPLPVFRKRDRARARLVELLTEVFERRAGARASERELFDVLLAIRNADGTPRYTIDQVTGMFISMMFAGHHTTSGTAAWTLIELLRNPGRDREGARRDRRDLRRRPRGELPGAARDPRARGRGSRSRCGCTRR
jgi:sterol 14-demethylase